MDAIELFHGNGESANLWYCGVCRKVHTVSTKELAEACCKCSECGEECRGDNGDYTGIHRQCLNLRNERRLEKKLAEAELVESYGGFVFIDGIGPQHGYFSSEEDAIDYIVGNSDIPEEDWPEFAFCCIGEPPPQTTIDEIVERMSEDMYEDAYSEIDVPEELQAALNSLWEINKHRVSYREDTTRKVRLNYDEGV